GVIRAAHYRDGAGVRAAARDDAGLAAARGRLCRLADIEQDLGVVEVALHHRRLAARQDGVDQGRVDLLRGVEIELRGLRCGRAFAFRNHGFDTTRAGPRATLTGSRTVGPF